MNQKDKLYKKFMAKKSIASKSRYNTARNVYYHTLKTKKNCYAPVFGKYKTDFKETWKNINYILGKSKVKTCTLLVIYHHISIDPLAIANHFNNHFASVASKLTENLPNDVTQYKNYLPVLFLNSMYWNPTNPSEIKKLIAELNLRAEEALSKFYLLWLKVHVIM